MTVSTPEWITVTLKVIQALEALNVPYFIVGSGASIIYGVVRATMDADLLADLKSEQAAQLGGSKCRKSLGRPSNSAFQSSSTREPQG